MFRALLTALFLVLFATPALAGADWVPVHVQKLTMLSDTDYVLAVSPEPDKSGYEDPWLGSCKRFVVHGSYKPLKGTRWFIWWDNGGAPTKKQHLTALAYLKKFAGSKIAINFGGMISGFNIITPKNPCIVASRALELVTDDSAPHETAVVSYFNRT